MRIDVLEAAQPDELDVLAYRPLLLRNGELRA